MTEEQLDDLIDDWHSGDSPKPLHEFLGMTCDEYEQFLRGDLDISKLEING